MSRPGQSEGPVLAAPEALGKVGEGAGARVSEAFDSTGKAIAAVAGLGVFFFATGYFVEWQRLKRGGLPPEQVLPLLPQAQIAAAGVRELAISVLFGGALLALLGFGLAALARVTRERSGPMARRLNDVLSGARQHEFPEPRPRAIAELKNGESFEATYVGTDAGKVLFRLREPGESTELIVLHDDELKSLRLMKSSYVFSVDASLIDRIVDPLFPEFQLSCIPPECRWEEEDHIGPSVFF